MESIIRELNQLVKDLFLGTYIKFFFSNLFIPWGHKVAMTEWLNFLKLMGLLSFNFFWNRLPWRTMLSELSLAVLAVSDFWPDPLFLLGCKNSVNICFLILFI